MNTMAQNFTISFPTNGVREKVLKMMGTQPIVLGGKLHLNKVIPVASPALHTPTPMNTERPSGTTKKTLSKSHTTVIVAVVGALLVVLGIGVLLFANQRRNVRAQQEADATIPHSGSLNIQDHAKDGAGYYSV